MKKMIVPFAVLLMATGAAFATKAAKTSQLAPADGYRIDAITGDCIDVEQQCSTIPNETCTWSVDDDVTLHSLDGTMCGDELFKP